MSNIHAFHLPGLEERDVAAWQEREAGTLTLRMPLLTIDGMTRCMERLEQAQQALSGMPVSSIIAAVDRVAHRLLDPADEMRQLADRALPPLTGYSPAMCRLIIERMAHDWTRPQLERLVRTELGDADVLDGFVERDGRQVMAVGPRITAHVLAGNIPGIGVTSLIRALLVRAASIAKTASGEPLLAPLFAQAITRDEPAIGRALAVTYWPGGNAALERAAFAAADAVIVYGGAQALAGVRAAAPGHARIVDHGPRLSAGFVARSALTDEAAARSLALDVAHAVATFDQQGCVSPHAVFVEDGAAVSPRAFAGMVSAALHALQQDLPRGTLTAGEAAAIRVIRARAEFGTHRELISTSDAPFTVILAQEAAFEPSCLQRTLVVHQVPALEDAFRILEPLRSLLQSAALAGDDDHPAALARIGFTRITSFADIPWPDPAAHHDGRGPLVELLDFVDMRL